MKLFHKIAVTTLGLAMATAVGAGIARYNRSDVKMARADTKTVNISYTDITDGFVATTGNNSSLQKTVASANDLTVQTKGINTKSKADAADHAYGYAMFLKNYGYIYNSTAPTGYYPSKVRANFTSGTGTSGKVGVSFGTAAITARDSGVTGDVVKSGYYELTNNDKTKFYWNFSTTGANVQIDSFVVEYKGVNDSDPTVTSVNVSAGAIEGTYKNFATIQCSAQVVGTDSPSQNVIWTLSSTNEYVAEQTELASASIDATGKVTFKQNATVYAFATSTVAGYTNKRGSVACTASSLKDLVNYVQLDRTQRLKAGLQVAILSTDGLHSLSTTQNPNNRGAVDATSEISGDYKISHIQEDNVEIFDLVQGSVGGSYAFKYNDGVGDKYLCAASSSNNYLRTTSTLNQDSSFTIAISDGVAEINCCNASLRGCLRFNTSASVFSCYTDNTANGTVNVSLYIAGTFLPEIVKLTSITDVSISNFEVYNSTTLTASYLPANATEGITVTATDGAENVELGAPIMADGVVTISVEGLQAGSVTLMLKNENYGLDGFNSISISQTFTVTPYNATHTKITSASALYNGLKVILGNSESELASGLHTGGNNVPAVTVGFSNDGSSLSNSGGNAVEYTLWRFTIDELTGWAFYDNGYFLNALTGSNNYLKRTLTLTKYCLFNITYTGDQVTIASVCDDVTKNTMFCNSGSKLFSCYASDTTNQKVFDLYSNNASSTDARIIAGYEDALLKMDAIDESNEGTNLCKTNKYYDFAKDVYNNVLTPAQKGLMSAKALERLEAWAEANGDHIDNYELVSSNHVVTLSEQHNSVLIIIVIASITTISLAGVFFMLRKRKHQ